MVSSDILKDDMQFSGSELDELEESEDEETMPSPERKEGDSAGIKVKSERDRKKWILFPAALLVLCIFVSIGFYLRKIKSTMPLDQKEIKKEERISLVQKAPIPKDQLYTFNSFVIPVKEEKRFTYFLLSICFNVPNIELKEEITENEAALRGMIFDRLREEIGKEKQIPSLDQIKKLISAELNKSLSRGKIKEVYVTEFLAV